MHNEIEIHLHAAGVRNRHEAGQSVFRPIAGRNATLLWLASKVAWIEESVAIASGAGTTLSLAGRRELYRGETSTAQRQRMMR
jgi:hypothetical protein